MLKAPTTSRLRVFLPALIVVASFALPAATAEAPDCAQISADFRNALDTIKTDYPRGEDYINRTEFEWFMKTTLPPSLPAACVKQVMGDIDNANVLQTVAGYTVSVRIIQNYTILGINIGVVKHDFRAGFSVRTYGALRYFHTSK